MLASAAIDQIHCYKSHICCYKSQIHFAINHKFTKKKNKIYYFLIFLSLFVFVTVLNNGASSCEKYTRSLITIPS